MTISVFDITGKTAVVNSDAQILFEKVESHLQKGEKVGLSLKGVRILPSFFLNVAIGQLYGKFSEEKINELLTYSDINDLQAQTLKIVQENSKSYFAKRGKLPQN